MLAKARMGHVPAQTQVGWPSDARSVAPTGKSDHPPIGQDDQGHCVPPAEIHIRRVKSVSSSLGSIAKENQRSSAMPQDRAGTGRVADEFQMPSGRYTGRRRGHLWALHCASAGCIEPRVSLNFVCISRSRNGRSRCRNAAWRPIRA